MKSLRRFFARLLNLAAGRADQRWLEEMEAHLAQQTADYVRAGMPTAEARRQAVLKFGAVGSIRKEYYTELVLPFIETLLQDLRYAFREFATSPGFASIAILTIALGIGATTAIYSVVDAELLHPLPYPQPEQLSAACSGARAEPSHDFRKSVTPNNYSCSRLRTHAIP